MTDILQQLFEDVIEEFTLDAFKEKMAPIVAKLQVKDRVLNEEEMPASGAFDIVESLSSSLKDFGVSNQVDRLGQVVLYTGNTVIKDKLNIRETNMKNSIGVIVAQYSGRVVLMTDHGFFGWINPEDCKIVNYVNDYTATIH